MGITVPYSFGFEDSEAAEFANWVLNPGALGSACVDQWETGNAVKSSGKSSLYISCDGGESANFGTGTTVQYAYRDFTLPQGQYELSFDWMCLGSPDAALYAGVGPAANIPLSASNTSSAVPTNVMSWCKTLGKLSGTSLWKNTSLKVSSNGTSVYRLFFVWTSSNRDTTIFAPLGGCIDNIQICSANCAKPKSVSATSTCDSILVRWDGTSEKYAFEYRRRGQKWSVPSIYEQEWCYVENVDEGLYDFRVRGICNGTDTSAYTYLNSFALFCPERHCINYVDLENENTTCYHGTFSNPLMNTGVINQGADPKYWRHSVNWDPDEYDPRTCNQLPTIPDGELASVRIGNWNNGAEGECIEYRYTADIENAAILLLKYAIVLEAPGHGPTADPHFTLEILDESGTLLSPTCGAADFYADANRNEGGWHTCRRFSEPVSWKEWTTIGLNLAEQGVKTGDVLTIRLTTKDCSYSAHYGYAYFTLGCAAARLSGTSCGSEPSLSVDAPDGFRYEWYNKYGELVATTQRLSVDPSDTTTYRCRLIYLENTECDFNLYSQVFPRFPIASYSYKYAPSNCENRVYFTNTSHVMTVFENDTIHNYDEGCEEYEWIFPNGEVSGTRNPTYVFPQSGGTFPVTLRAGISNGACVEDTTVYITIPAIGDTEQVIDSAICDGNYVQFGKYYAAISGVYHDSLVSAAGCDSILTLRLHINPVDTTYLPDTTVCAEIPLCIDGECYQHRQSGSWVRFRTNQYGCDSTIWMNVTMLDSILPTVSLQEPSETPGSGSITVGGTGYDYYLLDGVRYDASQTYHTGFDGGIFHFQFFNDFGCSVERSDTMIFECLEVRLGATPFVCADDLELLIPYAIDSGIPTTYTLQFDTIAHEAGFTDHIEQPFRLHDTVIAVDIPADVAPNVYHAKLILRNPLPDCEDIVYGLELPIHFSSTLIFQRWDDVLSIRNTEANGGYTFSHFQWLKNGQPIEGATLSYYYEPGGLDTDAEYRIEVVTSDSLSLSTCAFYPQPYTKPQESPKKIIEDQRLVIIHNGVKYNALGIPLQVREH